MGILLAVSCEKRHKTFPKMTQTANLPAASALLDSHANGILGLQTNEFYDVVTYTSSYLPIAQILQDIRPTFTIVLGISETP